MRSALPPGRSFPPLFIVLDPGRQALVGLVDLLGFFFRSAFVGVMLLHQPLTPALDMSLSEAAVIRQLK